MGAAIKLTGMDHSAAELRVLAVKSGDFGRSRRLLVVAVVQDGAARLGRACQAGIIRQTFGWMLRHGFGVKLALALWVLLFTACAADTMRGYIGQDIRVVELSYGPPSNQIDLGNGTRAFQWTKVSADTTPVSAISTTDKDRRGRKTTQTQFIGGDTTITRCLYTFITTRRGDSWIVTDIRQPTFDCAIGGLD